MRARSFGTSPHTFKEKDPLPYRFAKHDLRTEISSLPKAESISLMSVHARVDPETVENRVPANPVDARRRSQGLLRQVNEIALSAAQFFKMRWA